MLLMPVSVPASGLTYKASLYLDLMDIFHKPSLTALSLCVLWRQLKKNSGLPKKLLMSPHIAKMVKKLLKQAF